MAKLQKDLLHFGSEPEDPRTIQLWSSYRGKRDAIISRLEDFRRLWETASEEDLFAEIVFCLLTPMSSAKGADRAVRRLKESGLLYGGTPDEIAPLLTEVQYAMNKARFIFEARGKLRPSGLWTIRDTFSRHRTPFNLRDWLASSDGIKGLGMKEGGHVVRNLGLGGAANDIAILDRHILRRLKEYGLVDEVPTSMSRRRYLEIEDRFRSFASTLGIPMGHLDLLWWSDATGEIFK